MRMVLWVTVGNRKVRETEVMHMSAGCRGGAPIVWPLAIGALLAACDGIASADRISYRYLPLEVEYLESFGDTSSAAPHNSTLGLPSYVRFAPDGSTWVLDGHRLVYFDRVGRAVNVVGRRGRGPGELWAPLAIDVDQNGVVWVADVGNGKVLRADSGGWTAEFVVPSLPMGVAAQGDTVWVAGDFRSSLFTLYDWTGNFLGSVGVPANTSPTAFRFNQGAAVGGSSCAVVWAYTFRSTVECIGPSGMTRWRSEGPEPIAPSPHTDWASMSAADEFAYLDVAVANGHVYALYMGGPARHDGLKTSTVHVFDLFTGQFTGAQRLPRPAQYFARTDSLLAILDRDPVPQIHIYRISAEGR